MAAARHRTVPTLILAGALALAVTACAPPTVEPGLPGSIAPLVDADTKGWGVQAWDLSSGDPKPLDSATAGKDGAFTLRLDDEADVVYVEARGSAQPGGATLSAVVTSGDELDRITLNERTTVAAGYALAQFFDADLPSGDRRGLTNAATMAANLADPVDGGYGDVLTSYPNGTETEASATFTSLANALSACVADQSACATLYEIAGRVTDVAPQSTAAAFAAIARDPAPEAEALYTLSLAAADEHPGLSAAPVAWTIALRFDGDGQSLAGPGNFAMDAQGDIWVNNNYQYDADPQTPVCGSDELFEFAPNGELRGTYRGGGLSGSGFGIAFAPSGDLWLSNYGFAAPEPGCPEADQPPHNSMSLFTDTGKALSPDEGFTGGDLSWPQGIDTTADGSVWIANCGNSTVALYPEGDPDAARNLGSLGLDQPFDVVDNGQGIFITGNKNDAVAAVDYDGTPLTGGVLTGPFDAPMGIAADAQGNVWVANSGGISLPCPERAQQGKSVPSLVHISPDATAVSEPFTGGGLTLPWGLTTDGDGNLWVANFTGKQISHFCGADAATCPRGLQTGDAISPDEDGYPFDGLVRSTGIMVDTAGTVWVTNNWADVPLQMNPGGHQIVAFVGAAPPVPAPTFD